MAFCGSLDIVGSALTAERYRSDVILQNIANEKTTATESGEAYRRKQVIFEERPLTFGEELDKARGGVKIADVVESDRDFTKVFDPNHPESDENGYVTYSNVDGTEEMIDLMAVSNSYEANLSALTITKAMIQKTLDMGK